MIALTTKETSMSRLATHSTIEAAPQASKAMLTTVKKQLGTVPNMFRAIANSPAALEGYLSLSAALAKGALDACTRERLALAIAEVNGCGYCRAAHAYLGKHVAKLDDAEVAANVRGGPTDAKADAALRFAPRLVRERGHESDADLAAVETAGYDDGEVIEIVLPVALNTLTNYVNEVVKTVVDFPAA
jgi:uncharacterized peroxidase-related enzyme